MSRVDVWGAGEFAAYAADSVQIYRDALGKSAAEAAARHGIVRRHMATPGFRAVVVRDEAGRLLAFAYGFPGAAGQWWHEQVWSSLDPDVARRWLGDDFEVVELHVWPAAQGRGWGRTLLTTLLDGVGRSTAVLSAYDEETPARRLYRSAGFVDLLTGYRFPGNVEAYAVMGAVLPLSAPRRSGQDAHSGLR